MGFGEPKPIYVLQSGFSPEGYSVHSVSDTLEGAKNWPRNDYDNSYDWLIEEVPMNGKPRQQWVLEGGEWDGPTKAIR